MRLATTLRRLVATASLLAGCGVGMQAQEIVAPRGAADSALNAGDLARADSLYYAAARAHPRDPIVREALGRYLGMRGATKVAVVLLEEARLFGGDPARIASELAPLYTAIGDWRALLTLPSSPLRSGERARAAWLMEHAPTSLVDTTALTVVGPIRGDTIARVAVRVGSRAAMAAMLAQDVGVTIGARFGSGSARIFGNDSSIATVDQISIGASRLGNVPVTIGGPPGVVTLGLSELGPLVPTLDFAKNRVTLNRPLSTLAPIRLPMIRYSGVVHVLERGRWILLADYLAAAAKLKQTVTIDFKAGEVRVLP